jgi:hypothetical protein
MFGAASTVCCLAVACGGQVDDPRRPDASSSEDAGRCDSDIIGTWQLSSVSFVQTPPPSPAGTCGRKVLIPRASGSITFLPDGTFTGNAAILNDETITICSLKQSCADLQASLVGRGIFAACVEAGLSACTCSESFAPAKGYSTSGRYDDGVNLYCATGNELRWQLSSFDGTYTVIATRQ